MTKELLSAINSAKSVLILLPTNPHFDQVAAGLSLFLSVKTKTEAVICCPSPMLVEFNRLVGVDKITNELGNKNLTVKFVDYLAENVEKVSYDIENGQFKLTVFPKPATAAPKKEQIDISYSGISSDLVILIGGGSETHFPDLSNKDLSASKIVHIGVRSLAANPQKSIFSHASPSSSISEIVFDIVKEGGLMIDSDIATNLLMGIEEASKSFSSSETTAETFFKVSELMKLGGKRHTQREQFEQRRSVPPGAIPQPAQKVPKTWFEPKIYKGSGTPVS